MKFTLDWLHDHLDTKLSVDEIADKLTDIGIEVEKIVDESVKFKNFVIGQIQGTTPHPNADKLRLCDVNIGSRMLSIVCGAANAREGIFVVVAKVGAIIPSSGIKIVENNIRGEISEGMLCSAEELMLDSDGSSDEIMEIVEKHQLGTPISTALELNEIIFDISITPNRADCFSVIGIARELASIGVGQPIPLLSELYLHEFPVYRFDNSVEVDIQTEDCEYFTTCALQGVNFETPRYIARRLKAIGQQLIFGVVDVVNYVCFDVGQPMHVFDLEKIGQKLIVKNLTDKKKIMALDKKEYIIPQDAVVIDSEELGILSIAGVIGGEKSAYSEKTQNIFLEAAYFDKTAIARTGQSLRLLTEARTRFERGIDPHSVDLAMNYVISIITKNSDCKISKIKKYKQIPENSHTIELTYEKFHNISGLLQNEFNNSMLTLRKLGCLIVYCDEKLIKLTTPSFRHDLKIEEDIVEEVVRIYGYENIKEQELERLEPVVQENVLYKFSDAMVYNNFYEVKTFSFIDDKTAELFSPLENLVKIVSPLTIDFSTLRPSIIASHLLSLRHNQNRSQKNLRMFEIGKRFGKLGKNILEENMLTTTIAGQVNDCYWRIAAKDVSIFDIKEDLERLLSLVVEEKHTNTQTPKYYHPGRSGSYIINNDITAAYFGEIHPAILSNLGIEGSVVCFELFLERLPNITNNFSKNSPILSLYQSVVRDFSFIVDKGLLAAEILNVVYNIKIKEMQDLRIFDIYESETIGLNKKAVTFEIILQAETETLSETRIADISDKIITAVSIKCGAILRTIV